MSSPIRLTTQHHYAKDHPPQPIFEPPDFTSAAFLNKRPLQKRVLPSSNTPITNNNYSFLEHRHSGVPKINATQRVLMSVGNKSNVKVPPVIQQQNSDLVNADLRDAVYPPKESDNKNATPDKGQAVRRSLNLKQQIEQMQQSPMEHVNMESKAEQISPNKKASQTKLQRVVRAFTMDFPDVLQNVMQLKADSQGNTPTFEAGNQTAYPKLRNTPYTSSRLRLKKLAPSIQAQILAQKQAKMEDNLQFNPVNIETNTAANFIDVRVKTQTQYRSKSQLTANSFANTKRIEGEQKIHSQQFNLLLNNTQGLSDELLSQNSLENKGGEDLASTNESLKKRVVLMTYNNIQLPNITSNQANNNTFASHIEYANKSMQSRSTKGGIEKTLIEGQNQSHVKLQQSQIYQEFPKSQQLLSKKIANVNYKRIQVQFKNKVILVKSEHQRLNTTQNESNAVTTEAVLSNYQKYLLENKPAPYRNPSKFSIPQNSTAIAAQKLIRQFQLEQKSEYELMYNANPQKNMRINDKQQHSTSMSMYECQYTSSDKKQNPMYITTDQRQFNTARKFTSALGQVATQSNHQSLSNFTSLEHQAVLSQQPSSLIKGEVFELAESVSPYSQHYQYNQQFNQRKMSVIAANNTALYSVYQQPKCMKETSKQMLKRKNKAKIDDLAIWQQTAYLGKPQPPRAEITNPYANLQTKEEGSSPLAKNGGPKIEMPKVAEQTPSPYKTVIKAGGGDKKRQIYIASTAGQISQGMMKVASGNIESELGSQNGDSFGESPAAASVNYIL